MSQESSMSATMEPPTGNDVPQMMPELTAPVEFDYRPVPASAPISVFLGVCSVIALAVPAGVIVPLLGVVVGGLSARKIARHSSEFGGWWVAMAGLVISAAFLAAGSTLHAYSYVTELPEGHERVSFSWLAKQEPAVADGDLKINPEAEKLDGKKVYIKGYMYPTNQSTDLTQFVLCKDTGDCCFGGNPKITDMIMVKFKPGMTVDHREKILVGVGGTFRAKKVIMGGQVVGMYSLEGEHFR